MNHQQHGFAVHCPSPPEQFLKILCPMYSNIYAAQDNLLQVTPAPGGYCNVYAVAKQYISTWPSVNPQTGILQQLPEIIPGKTWLGIENMPGNAIYKEEEQDSNAGTWFNITVTAPLADDNAAQYLRSMAIRHHQLVLLLVEHNGMVRLIGGPDAGATVKQSYTSADDEGTRQRILTINWESDAAAMLVDPAALELVEFSTEYSYEFN